MKTATVRETIVDKLTLIDGMVTLENAARQAASRTDLVSAYEVFDWLLRDKSESIFDAPGPGMYFNALRTAWMQAKQIFNSALDLPMPTPLIQ